MSDLEPIEDTERLAQIAVALKGYIPADYKCSVDRKKKRLYFQGTFKAGFLSGFMRQSKYVGNAPYVSAVTTALSEGLRRAEEELRVKFRSEGIAAVSFVSGIPILHYRVFGYHASDSELWRPRPVQPVRQSDGQVRTQSKLIPYRAKHKDEPEEEETGENHADAE